MSDDDILGANITALDAVVAAIQDHKADQPVDARQADLKALSSLLHHGSRQFASNNSDEATEPARLNDLVRDIRAIAVGIEAEKTHIPQPPVPSRPSGTG